MGLHFRTATAHQMDSLGFVKNRWHYIGTASNLGIGDYDQRISERLLLLLSKPTCRLKYRSV